MSLRRLCLLLAAVSLVAARPVPPPPAVPYVLPRTLSLELPCAENGVRYRLDLALPRGHGRTPGQRWPLLLVLDSDYAFAIARNVVEHLSDRNDLPPLLVVGVGYAGSETIEQYRRHRSRDYTPSRSLVGGYGPEYQAASGGAAAFRRCIEGQVLPLLERHYGAGHPRVLSGHSYGGLFSADTLLRRPASFDAYLMVSPSLWYDRHLPRRWLQDHAAALEGLQARVYGGVGAFEHGANGSMPDDLAEFFQALTGLGQPGLCLRHEVLDGETHNSVYPRALSNGLRFLWGRRSSAAAFGPCAA